MRAKDEYKLKYREHWMTEKEMKEIDNRITLLIQNQGEMGDLYSRWEKEEEAYKGDQPEIANRPNSRVNIVNATIEGQISSVVDQNIAVVTRGESPADTHYAEWARIGLEWSLRKNRIKKVIEQHERRRLKFGVGVFKLYFDEYAINGFGLPKLCCPPLNRIFIDRKVKDYLRFQEADYIAEPIRMSKTQFEELYGEEKANAISYGKPNVEDVDIFDEDISQDDDNGATLIQWYERYKGKLRLLEFTADGLLLYDSHKKGDRTTNQIKSEYKRDSYYKNVDNKYPYFFTPLYPEEGSLWGFGDAKLLMPIQNMINDLYDKIRIAARPNLILFDPSSEVDLDDFDENSYEARPAMLDKEAVKVVQWGQVNPALWQLLGSIHQEAQRVTRYSDLMIGQGRSSETATEASIQQQQGNSTTDHKKLMLQETLIEVCEYMLGMMMEFYKGAKAFRISEDKDQYEWIDFRQLKNVPVMKPASRSFIKQYQDKNGESPEWELVNDKNNNPLTKNVDLDIEINIGAGLPKNKTFLWQMVQTLASVVVLDDMGQQKNLISYNEFRKFIKDFLGLPLDDNETENAMIQTPQQAQANQQAQAQAQSDGKFIGSGLTLRELSQHGVPTEGAMSPPIIPSTPLQSANAPLSPTGNPLGGLL